MKKTLKNAIGPSLGVMIGGMIFRLSNPNLYNETWPNISVHAILYFALGYVGSFLVIFLIEAVKAKSKEE